MDYQEVFSAFLEMKEVLIQKKQSIIKRDLEKLNQTDEMLKVLVEKIEKFDLKNSDNNFSEAQKTALRALGCEIKEIQDNNEILIKHSLDVINRVLSGILNICNTEKNSYNSKGMGCADGENLNISSITEEA